MGTEGQTPLITDTLEVHGYTSLGPNFAKSYFPFKENNWAIISGRGIAFNHGNNVERMRIDGKGNIGIGTKVPGALLDVKGSGDPLVVINHTGRSGNPAIWFKQNGKEKAYIWVNQGTGDLNFGIQDINPIISLQNEEIGTPNPRAKLVVFGTDSRTEELEITGGGDRAEPFDIAGSEAIKPGMVMAIDPEHPGQLRIADKAYDRTVARTVSGAKGINPGLTMRQEGSAVDGSLPVALSGRVYCWADAFFGQIQPGDLLTTSDTPGHAMKGNKSRQSPGRDFR